MKSTFHIEPWMTAIGLVVITTPIIFKGIKSVAVVSEWLVPIMTVVYALIAVAILVLHASAIPEAIVSIFEGAFGVNQAFAGTAGGLFAAALNGVKRGLFSNEAGEGSVPNIAATATVSHPVQQGFVQSLGVFVDTIVVCTVTALIVLLSEVYTPAGSHATEEAAKAAEDAANTLTSASVTHVLGGWAQYLMAIIIFVFAYSSLLGNYTYAQVNMDYLQGKQHKHYALRGHDYRGHRRRLPVHPHLRVEPVRPRHGGDDRHQHGLHPRPGRLGLRGPARLGGPASRRRGR